MKEKRENLKIRKNAQAVLASPLTLPGASREAVCSSPKVDSGGGLACLLPCELRELMQPKQAGLGRF